MTTTTTFLHPTASTFAQEILGSDEPVLVKFWAPWCGPCRAVKPIVEAIAGERGLRTGFVNVDDEPELAQQFGIQSIPALKLFQNGEIVAKLAGARSKSELEAWLEANGA